MEVYSHLFFLIIRSECSVSSRGRFTLITHLKLDGLTTSLNALNKKSSLLLMGTEQRSLGHPRRSQVTTTNPHVTKLGTFSVIER